MERYQIADAADLIVARPEGEITSNTYPTFEKLVFSKIEVGTKFLMNMEKVDFIDSQGAAFMLRMRELVQANEGYFSIYNLNPYIYKVLSRLRLEAILNTARNPIQCFRKMLGFEMKRACCGEFLLGDAETAGEWQPDSISATV